MRLKQEEIGRRRTQGNSSLGTTHRIGKLMDKRDYQDFLTKICNRVGLFHHFEQMDPNSKVCVMFMDLDNFKMVNDTYGHKKGDETLILFARLLEKVMPEDSIVARLGGDEFASIIQGASSKEIYEKIAQNLLDELKLIKKTDRAMNMISSSIGIVHDYPVKKGLDAALSYADKAMYFAKEQGKNTYIVYSDYEQTIDYESRIAKDYFNAIKEGRIFVKYQPVHHLQSSRIVSTEACCLWELPDGKVLGRNDFRHILLKSELINEMDAYVFEQVCQDMAAMKKYINDSHRVAVQFSHLFFLDDHRVRELTEILNRYSLNTSDFEICLDESMFSSRIMPSKLLECVKKLAEKGFTVALSHFGEDFSSVKYLRDLSVTKLKLDGDFISKNIKDAEGIRVLKSAISLGAGFKFSMIGCDADDEKSLIALSECGFHAATGLFFCDKLPAKEYAAYLKKNLKADSDTIYYRFKKDFKGNKANTLAKVVGEDLELVDGITKNWGAVRFPGGPSQTNYLRMPVGLFDSGSYSFSMWIKPRELQNWVSALYIRFQAGFLSFMPNIAGGRCMLRIMEDANLEKWNDLMTGAISVGKWTFVACSYDSLSGIARIYINGELEAELTGVPALDNPKEVWLGGDVFQNSFCGFISAFQVNAKALENEEIKKRYEEFLKEDAFDNRQSTDEVVVTEIEVHDPAIYEDKQSKCFYIYGTTGCGYSSKDLVHWKPMGQLVKRPNKEAIDWTGSEAIWAPDIVKVGDEYRLYCTNSSWGVRQSCIFLAVSDSAKGPFLPKGIVLKTSNAGDVNAIDANIIEDPATGRQYMVYGSFWGGIRIVELNKETGFLLDPSEITSEDVEFAKKQSLGDGQEYLLNGASRENLEQMIGSTKKLGKKIAQRPRWNDSAIEGPYIIYHPDTQYFYLFVSYGSLTCDYNIRVGRSKNITGPYLDYNGRDMVDLQDKDCTTGLMVSCGYRYLDGEAKMGPGHNSVLLRENGEIYLVSHIRKLAFNTDIGPGLLQIRKMVMTPDGWPIALGEPYNAETLLRVRDDLLHGAYERIELRPSIPQGIQHAHPMKILKGGRLEMASVVGSWTRVDEYTLQLEYGPITEYVHFEKGLDKEKNRTTVVMGGLTSQGICTWAKKSELSYQGEL